MTASSTAVFGIPAPRIPQLARIRAGGEREQGRWGKPLEHFRFTGSKVVMDRVATVYGGEVTAWRDEFQVLTETPSIKVLLPADPSIALSVEFLQFDAGGRMLRRCDATECESYAYEDGPEGVERIETTAPCTCAVQGDAGEDIECDCRTLLTVMCPDLRLGGSCSFSSSSDQVAKFMQGAIQAARFLQPTGLLSGWLSIVPGKKNLKGFPYSLTMLQLDIADMPPDGSGGEVVAPAALPPPPAAKPQIEPPSTPPEDSAPPAPEPARRRKRKGPSPLVATLRELDGVETGEAALAVWEGLTSPANAERLRELRAQWLLWSSDNPKLAMAIGPGVTRAFKSRRVALDAVS